MKQLVLMIFCLSFTAFCFGQDQNDQAKIKKMIGILSDMQLEITYIDLHVTEFSADTNGFHKKLNQLDKDLTELTSDTVMTNQLLLNRLVAYKNDAKVFSKYNQNFILNIKNRNHIQNATYQDHITYFSNLTDGFVNFLNELLPKQQDKTLLNAIIEVNKKVTDMQADMTNLSNKVQKVNSDVVNINNKMATQEQLMAVEKKIDDVNNNMQGVSNIVSVVNGKADKILSLLQPVDSAHSVVGINVFDRGAMGGFYFSTIGKSAENKNAEIVKYLLGAEAIIPAGSTTIRDSGGFLLFGIQENHLEFDTGLGYLPNSKAQNISWKFDATYFMKKIGIGLGYSPLSNIGLQLAFRF